MVVALLALIAKEGHLFCESSNLGSFPDAGPGFGLAPDGSQESHLSTRVLGGSVETASFLLVTLCQHLFSF